MIGYQHPGYPVAWAPQFDIYQGMWLISHVAHLPILGLNCKSELQKEVCHTFPTLLWVWEHFPNIANSILYFPMILPDFLRAEIGVWHAPCAPCSVISWDLWPHSLNYDQACYSHAAYLPIWAKSHVLVWNCIGLCVPSLWFAQYQGINAVPTL